MSLIDSLYNSFEEIITPYGFTVVRVQINGSERKVLQVMIERLDDVPINVDDCAKVSRVISVHMDVNNPIAGAYTLEISSTGLERPLVKPKDYKRFINSEIVVRTVIPVENRKNFQGVLESADDSNFSVRLKQAFASGDDLLSFSYADVKQAHLVYVFE